jgi:hypothetical protein
VKDCVPNSCKGYASMNDGQLSVSLTDAVEENPEALFRYPWKAPIVPGLFVSIPSHVFPED